MTKTKMIDLMSDLYEELSENAGNSYFEIDGKRYSVDAGYALDGIRIFIEVLRKRLKMGYTRKEMKRFGRKWREAKYARSIEEEYENLVLLAKIKNAKEIGTDMGGTK